MSSPESAFRKRIVVICACGALALIALAVAQARGVLSLQIFALLAIGCWFGMFAFLLPAVRRFNRESAAQKRSRLAQGLPSESPQELARSIRGLKRYIAVVAMLFPLLLWANRDQPRSSEIAGAAAWLLLVAILVRSLWRRQRQLKALADLAKPTKPQ